jgi:TonB family protein
MKIGSVMETIQIVAGPGPEPPARPRLTQVPRVEKPDPCATSSAGACVRPPAKIRDVRPIFPPGVDAGSGSVVILEALIDTNGLVTGVKVLRSPDPALSNAAMDAVNGWEFLPTHLDGEPIETKMTVTMNFVGAK